MYKATITRLVLALAIHGCAAGSRHDECEAPEGVECAPSGVDDGSSITPDLSRADDNAPRNGRFALTDANRRVDSDGASHSDVPVYQQSFSIGDEVAPEVVRQHARVRSVRVEVDIDYARADAVGIWLKNSALDTEQLIRMPQYAGAAASSYRGSFTTNAFQGAPAFAGWTVTIGGTEYAVGRDCYTLTNEVSGSATSTRSRSVLWGLYRSGSSESYSYSSRQDTRHCNFFFSPLHVRSLRVIVDYDVPTFPSPRVGWSIPVGFARIGSSYVHHIIDESEEVPSLLVRPVGVDMKLRMRRETPVRLFLIPPGCSEDDCRVGLVGTDANPRSLVYNPDGTANLRHSIAFPTGARLAGTWQLLVDCDVYRTVCDRTTRDELGTFAILDGSVQFNGGR